MSYIFRLNTVLINGQGTLPTEIKGWGKTNDDGYASAEIAQIPPSNPNCTNEPTSIPSPFARLALTKAAFKEVAEKGTNALRAYQQIVSNSLDVAEIFFNFDSLKDHIGLEIIKWQFSNLQNIQSSILKSTLELFFSSDADPLNLSTSSTFYFLRHINTGKIIGGTSPRTLFFSAANVKRRKGGIVEPEFIKIDGTVFVKSEQTNTECEFGKIELGSVKRHFAFKGITPLSKRDIAFQDYLHQWRKTYSILPFPEISEYLTSQIEANQVAHFGDLANNMNSYKPLQHKGDDELIFYPEILTKHLYKQDIRISEDYFEDKIIQLKKPITNGFFSGNHTNADKTSVLLPLKCKFFEDFTIEQLREMISIDGSASIKVTLHCTINEQIVTFEKDYKNDDIIVLSEDVDFMLFPNVKFNDATCSFYRFGLFRGFNEIKKMSAKFFNQLTEIPLSEINEVINRNKKDNTNSICTTYALEKKEFDRVNISIDDNIRGIIIPELKKKENNVDFVFAVDFGTTNTHIEYKTNTDGNIKPFDITPVDEQISWFVNPGERVHQTRLVADIDFIPEHIGYENTKNIKVKFPTRTALIVANNITTNIMLPFAHTNIVMPFDKRNVPDYNGVPITQLKWEADVKEVGYYIDNLCYLMRNKVVLNNGRLSNTKILWTYPLSMNIDRIGEVADKWEDAYKKYFPVTIGENEILTDYENRNNLNAESNCKNLTESLAPFYYYSNLPNYNEYINNLVSIDIGGGTTDVVFVINGEPNFVTSFRFAANDLFGLGENISKIISKHKHTINTEISVLGNRNTLSLNMNSIEQNTDSSDLASFFFALNENEDLIEKGKIIDFNKMLKEDKNQKIVFLLFYTAIIYHTAQVMAAQNKPMPRHLTFSGNGSRIIDVLGKINILEKLATLIFEKTFNKNYGSPEMPTKLEIIPNISNPKEVTCKGTIKSLDIILPDVSKKVLLGIDSTSFSNNRTYNELNMSNDDLIDKINIQVSSFLTYVFDELLKKEIKKQVDTEAIEIALSIPKKVIDKAKEIIAREDDMRTITKNKIEAKDKSSKIEETFFFFPIPTLLRTISKEIENLDK